MAIDDEEDWEDVEWQHRQEIARLQLEAWEEEDAERREREIRVRFTVEGGKVKGRVIRDERKRTKIVFPARSWKGHAPQHGEEIEVRVVHETYASELHRGVLFVERKI